MSEMWQVVFSGGVLALPTTFEGFAFGRDFEKQMFNLKTNVDMKNESSINNCTPPAAKHLLADSAFSEGDKIAWSTIVNGKVARIKGNVSSIVGETMCCIGKCVATGNWFRDFVSIHDKSVSRL